MSTKDDGGGAEFPIEKTSLRPYLIVSAPISEVLNVCEVKNVPLTKNACTK